MRKIGTLRASHRLPSLPYAPDGITMSIWAWRLATVQQVRRVEVFHPLRLVSQPVRVDAMTNERNVSELAGKLRSLSVEYMLVERPGPIEGNDSSSPALRPSSPVMRQLHEAVMLCGNLYSRLVAPRLEDIGHDPLAARDGDGFIRRRLTDPAEQSLARRVEKAMSFLVQATHGKFDDREFGEQAEKIAAGLEGAVGVRSDATATATPTERPPAKLPKITPCDRQAWQLATLHGMTQDKVAAALNREHGTTYTQGQVSRMIARAKAHADANGLAEKVAGPIDRPRTVDPGRLDLGERVDKRKPRPSDMARANDDDE